MLHLARDLIALRTSTPDLCVGTHAALPAPEGLWAWRRGARHVVVVNCTDGETGSLEPLTGTILIATDRARDGERVEGALRLPGPGAVVVEITDAMT